MNLFSYLTESERDSYVSERMIEVENSIFFSSMRMIEEEYDTNLLLAEVKVCRENGTDTDLTYLYEAATAQQEIDQRGPIKRIIDAIMKLIRSIKNKLFGAVDEEEGDDNAKLKLFENLKADGEQIKKIFDSFKNALTSALNGNGAQAWIELGQVGQEFAGLSVVSKIAAGAGAAGAAIFVKRKDLKRLRRYAISFTEFIEKNLGKLESKLNSLTTNSITESFLFLMEADNNSGNNQQPANGANQQQTNQTNDKGGQQKQQTTPPPKQTQNTGNNNNQNQNNTQQTTSNNNQKPAQNSNNGNNEPRQQNSASKFVGSIKQKAIKIAKEQLLPAIQSGIGKLRTFIQRCNYYLNISEARDRENQENREGIKADLHGSKANATRDQLEDRKKELSKQVDDLNKSLKTADENERPKIEKKIRDLNKEISKIDNTIKKNTTDTDEERYQDHKAVQDHLSGTGTDGKKNENENNNNDEDQKDQTDDNDTGDSNQQTDSNKGQGQQENEKNSDKNVKNQNQNSNQRSKNDQNSTTQVKQTNQTAQNTGNNNQNQTKKETSQEDNEKKKLAAERKKILDPKFKEIDEKPQIDEDIYERLNDKGKELYAQIVDLRKGQEREKVFKNEDRLKEIEQNLKDARNELKNNVDKYTNPKQNSTNQTTQEKGEKGNNTSSKNSKNNSQKDPGRWSEDRDKAINYLTDNDIENFDRTIYSLSGNSGFFVPHKKGKVGLSAKNLEDNSTNIDFWNAVVKDFKENPSKKRADYLKKLAPTMFSDDAVKKRRESKDKEDLEKYTQSVNSIPQIDEDAFKRLTAEGKKEYNRANNLQIEQLKLRKAGKLSEANKMRRDAWDLLDKIENDTTGKYLKPSKSTAKQESFDWFDDEEEPFSSLFLFDD